MNTYKKDFPIFKQTVNGKPLVYLDSAATSQKPRVVIDAVSRFYETSNANIHRGIYSLSEKATQQIESTRGKVAQFIHAKDASEIAFTHGTTEGINILANSFDKTITQKKHILTTITEHHSNFVPWQHIAGKNSSQLFVLDIDRGGALQDEVVNFNHTSQKISVFTLPHVSNVLGTIHPINDLMQKLRKQDIISSQTQVIVDAAQSAPHMPVNLQDIMCDYLVFSGHKMLAPSGIGVLYGRGAALDELDPFLYGSQMIDSVSLKKTTFRTGSGKLEAGTLPLEAIVGLGAAIDYLSDIGMNKIRSHEMDITSYALEKLSKVPRLTILGPKKAEERSGVIAFTLDGIHPHDVAQMLSEDNICVRAGHHCAMPLHQRLGIPASVRISFNIYNDEEDIDILIRSLEKAQKIFK